MNRIRSLLVGVAMFGIAGVAVAQQAAPVIVIKFSHVLSRDTPKGLGAERFKELAEKATNGRVRVDLFHNSSLYKDKEELEALALGAVQMLAPSFSKFGPLGVKEFEAFDFPYIFPDKNVLHQVTQGPIGASLLKKLEPKGIVGLAYWDSGFKVMTANRPLHLPADFKGLKMRIQSSKVLDAEMRALGANPQVTTMAEAYQSLQTGVVDGQENTPSNVYTQKFYEVQKHLTVSNHGYIGWIVVANKKFWDALPADIRTQLEGALRSATTYANAIAQQENDVAMDAIKKSGKTTVYVLNAKENAAWRQALLPVRKQMEGRVGKEIISQLDKEAATSAAK
jgi:C4-dicarboxylate-binding protein DctP